MAEEPERKISYEDWILHLRFIALEITKDAHKRDELEPCGMNAGAAMTLGRAIKNSADYFEKARDN